MNLAEFESARVANGTTCEQYILKATFNLGFPFPAIASIAAVAL
jgi:hypothetical protein